MTEPDEWQNYIRAQIGPLLAGRNLSAGGSFETACDEIADALRADYTTLAQAAAERSELTTLRLVPVEVFGGASEDEGVWAYGLSDAASAWSDCNRAVGHIYRVDDLAHLGNAERTADTVEVLVRPGDRPFFDRTFGEARDDLLPSWVLPFVRWATTTEDTPLDFEGAEIPDRLNNLIAAEW